MEIGEVAKRTGVRPSAVRYYEKCGLIAPDRGTGGRRVFSNAIVERLLLIRYAKQLGFTLTEVRKLFEGFEESRWTRLAAGKLAEVDALSRRLETMRDQLLRIAECRCPDLTHCAHAIAEHRCSDR